MRTPRKMLCGATLFVLLFAHFCKAQSPTDRPGPPDERLRLAGSLAREGRIDEAVEQYLSYYADNPEDHSALGWIARLYEKSGRAAEAIEFLEKYLLTGASSPGGYSQFESQCHRLLRLWEEAGGIQAAQKHYLGLTEDENTTATELILAQVMLGRIREQKRDAAGALDHHLATLELISPADDGLRKTVNSLLLHKFIGKNLLDYAVAAYRNCPDPTQMIELGDRLRRDGRGFEMLNLYEDYLLSPTPESTADAHQWHDFSRYRHNSLAAKVIDELVSLGQADPLLEQLDAATVQQTAGAELYRNLAYLLLKMKRHEEAIGEFENYFAAVERPLASDYEWVAGLCRNAGFIDHAIRFYEFARDTGFTDEEIRRESMMSQMSAPMGNWKARFKARILQPLGNLYMEKSRWVDAEACFKEIVDSKATWSTEEAKASLAKVWENLGKENIFIEESKAEVAAEPCNVELATRHAETLQRAGKTREAIEQYQRAVELSPEDLSARLKLADALARDRQDEKAIDEYLKVLHAGLIKDKSEFRRSKGGDPTEPARVLNVLARFCKRNGQGDRLLEVYQEVLSLLDSPETKWKPERYVLERILRDMTDILETKGEHMLIAELWLDYRKQVGARARWAIDDRLRYFDSLTELVAELREETKADSNDYWGRFILGDMLLTEHREGEAVQVYTSLLNDVPEPHRIHHDLGQLFERRLKRYNLALQAYQRALSEVEPGTRDYANRLSLVARTHVKLGNQEKAGELYRQAISLDPRNTDYRRELSKATGIEEEELDVGEPEIGPAEDLSVKRRQASLLANKKD
ncbi:MAG: tetratricopeptide repeat protein, partial [Planctomycetota bacterium]